MRFRGECGHCGFVAKSIVAMQKHMASHEENHHHSDEDIPEDGATADYDGTEASDELLPDKDEVEAGQIREGATPLNTEGNEGDRVLLEGSALDFGNEKGTEGQEDLATPIGDISGAFSDGSYTDSAFSGDNGINTEGNKRSSEGTYSHDKLKANHTSPFHSKELHAWDVENDISKLPTLRSLLICEGKNTPEREEEQLNSDDFITFLKKDAGYVSNHSERKNRKQKQVTNSSSAEEIGSEMSSWTLDDADIKQKLSFYCRVAGCKETLSTLDILEGHLRFEHPKVKDSPQGYLCKVHFCNKRFRRFGKLLKHVSVDHCNHKEEDDNDILCIVSHCKKKFSSMDEAARHTREEHSEENLSLIGLKKIKSDYIVNATADFNTVEDLPPAKTAGDLKTESIKLEQPNETLSVKEIKKLTAGPNYKCDLEKCRMHFKSKAEFAFHVRTLHASIGACVYYCGFCPFAATTMETVKQHTRTVCEIALNIHRQSVHPKPPRKIYSPTKRKICSPRNKKVYSSGKTGPKVEIGYRVQPELKTKVVDTIVAKRVKHDTDGHSTKKKSEFKLSESDDKDLLDDTAFSPDSTSGTDSNSLVVDESGVHVVLPHRRVSSSGRPVRMGRMKLCQCCTQPQHRRRFKKPNENDPPAVAKNTSKQTARKSMISRQPKFGPKRRNKNQTDFPASGSERLLFDANGVVIKEEPEYEDMYGVQTMVDPAASQMNATDGTIVKVEPGESPLSASSTVGTYSDLPGIPTPGLPNNAGVINITPQFCTGQKTNVFPHPEAPVVKTAELGKLGSLSSYGGVKSTHSVKDEPVSRKTTPPSGTLRMPIITPAMATHAAQTVRVVSSTPVYPLANLNPPQLEKQSVGRSGLSPGVYKMQCTPSVTKPSPHIVSGTVPSQITESGNQSGTAPQPQQSPFPVPSEQQRKKEMTLLKVPVKGMDGKFLLVDITPLVKNGQQVVIKPTPVATTIDGSLIYSSQGIPGTQVSSPSRSLLASKVHMGVVNNSVSEHTVKVCSPKVGRSKMGVLDSPCKVSREASGGESEEYFPCEEHVEENAFFSYDPEAGEMEWDDTMCPHDGSMEEMSHIWMDSSDSPELDTSMSNEESSSSYAKAKRLKRSHCGPIRVSSRPRKPLVKSCFCEACMGIKRKRKLNKLKNLSGESEIVATPNQNQWSTVDDPKLKMRPLVIIPDIFKLLLFGSG